MKNTGFRVIKNFPRVSSEVLEKFRDIPVSILDDSMNRTAAISSSLFPVNNVRMLGSAYTVRVQHGDNLLFYYALEQAKPGDVIIVDGGGYSERALCGEIMVTYAQKRHLSGIVVYGAIRDKQEIVEIGFPVFASAVTPNGPYKNGPGEINVPVNIGGRVICPGDIIVGDGSGLVSIKPNDVDDVLKKAQLIIQKEKNMMTEISDKNTLNLDWVHKKLQDCECEFIEEANYDYYI